MSGSLTTMPDLEPHLPRPDLSRVQPQVRTGDWTDQFRGQLRGGFRSAPIWHVRYEHRCFRLVRPLLVRVRQDEDFCFAENDTLRLVGTGTNSEEALADFCLHLVHFHQYYTRIPAGEIVGEGKRLKRLFEGIFVEER